MHIQVSLIGPNLLEVVKTAANVPKVNVENLLALTEILDNLIEFGAGIF